MTLSWSRSHSTQKDMSVWLNVCLSVCVLRGRCVPEGKKKREMKNKQVQEDE